MQSKIVELMRQTVPDDGQHIWGLADLSGLLHERFKGYSYGISIGRKLDDAIIDSIITGTNMEYYRLYKETNVYLLGLVTNLAAKINALGVRSLAITPTSNQLYRSPEYTRTLRHYFSHKMVGTRAGLGWIGKSDLFVSVKFGPRLRLASILVDFPLKPLEPTIDSSRCGKCNVCVEACPARAATGKLWNIKVDRDEFYDAYKCRDKAKEISLAATGQNKDEICGICIAVCPAGRK
ncbi:MAG: 4Fe-4S binding protein [Chloroflexi bacterium]|nr:4Fe-4S binding protein [Chloroflexota bacterium]